MRAWPRVLSLSLGMVPVLALAGIAGIVIARGSPALTNIGLSELFGNNFSSQYGSGENIFGLLPAIWGTVMVTAIAMLIATPVSLALALVSTEFSLGILSRGVRLVLGLLGGIPSIVYALAAVVLVTSIMIPKFAAGASNVNDFSPQTIGYTGDWPPADVPFTAGGMPWGAAVDPNSTILGGFLIALLIIPFMAPMVEDAIRSVPAAQREASLALGTTRWHTLRRIILPYASPGLISAMALSSLKAMGDVMIAIFVIGFEAQRLPGPIIDVFQRDPPLSAVGANLLGGLAGQGSCSSLTRSTVVNSLRMGEHRCDAAYFSALMLMIIAFVVLITAFYLQGRFRRRYAR